MFSNKELTHDKFVLEEQVESSDDDSECNKDLFSLWCNWLCWNIYVLQILLDYLKNSTMSISYHSSM